MKSLKRIFLMVVALLGMTVFGKAQTTTTSTTLSADLTATATTLTVASATGFTANTTGLFLDREFMNITAVSGTTISVARGTNGTRAEAHETGATIYVGPLGNGPFISYYKSGSCTSTNELYLPQIHVASGSIHRCSNGQWLHETVEPFWVARTMLDTEGVSPSYKGIYANLTIPNTVTEGTQNIKAVQGWATINASTTPAEVWGIYGGVDSSGNPTSGYGVAGDFVNTASAPTGAAVGVLGTYDGVVGVTATPGATGLFSAAVMGQVWDRNTSGPTAVILAVTNGDTNRQAANPVGAAFKAINRNISFATGFNYGLDLFVESPFTRGALLADIRLGTGAQIRSGTGAPTAGDCAAGTLGSIYLNRSGGANTTLYVCQTAGSWNAVTP